MSPEAIERLPEFGLAPLWSDGPCLVLNKPSGLSTQAPRDCDSLESRLRTWIAAHPAMNQYLGLPHRLDRATSGAIVFALRQKAARRLAKQFERREVGKTYWAIVQGRVEPPAGRWEDYVRKIPDRPKAEVVTAETSGAQSARLTYRLLAAHPDFSWIELQLLTGRMHQIRVQAARRNYPVLGDIHYGATRAFTEEHEQAGHHIALHAHELSFRHPLTREPVVVRAPLPDRWDRLTEPGAEFTAPGSGARSPGPARKPPIQREST